MKSLLIFGSLAVSLLLGSVAHATTFDTSSAWDGSSSISGYGGSATTTYGQTFVAPSDSTLNSFTFYLRPNTPVTSTAYVFAWQGSLLGGGGGRATGPALFQSSSIVTTGD